MAKLSRKSFNKAEQFRKQLPSHKRQSYKSYNFRDKDPIIDEIERVVTASGRSLKQIEEASSVKVATLQNWFAGRTKRPQFATANAVCRALGYELRPIPRNLNVVPFKSRKK